MAGFEPAPQGLEGPQAAVTPHSLWFGLRDLNPSLRAGNAGCSLHTQAERGTGVAHRPIDIRQLSKTPLLRAERQGTRAGPCWRQRQDSNPDPQALEARMLPLHHAADVTSRLEPSRRQNPPAIWRGLPPSVRPKQKRPSRGSPQKACFSMSAEPLGRLASVIKRATGVAIDPTFGHGSRHTGDAWQRSGQIEWPRWRCALRVGELNRHLKPRDQCRERSLNCQDEIWIASQYGIAARDTPAVKRAAASTADRIERGTSSCGRRRWDNACASSYPNDSLASFRGAASSA